MSELSFWNPWSYTRWIQKSVSNGYVEGSCPLIVKLGGGHGYGLVRVPDNGCSGACKLPLVAPRTPVLVVGRSHSYWFLDRNALARLERPLGLPEDTDPSSVPLRGEQGSVPLHAPSEHS